VGRDTALELKRRAFLLGIACCAVPACAPMASRSSNPPPPGSTQPSPRRSPTSRARDASTSPTESPEPSPVPRSTVAADPAAQEVLIQKYSGEQPLAWGDAVPGVTLQLPTTDLVVALTLDACGGHAGSGYDETLIETLRRERVPATLFVNARWIEANRQEFQRLAADPPFEIANHGTEHRPLSVTGQSVYGIAGTANVADVVHEVSVNQRLVTELTGIRPAFFRSGTAYYDDVAVRVVADLGLQVVNFDVLGDAGATYSATQVTEAILTSTPGSIILAHFNQPGSGTAAGVAAALPELRQRGLRPVRPAEYLH
jgi:peptidoglycan/xylan/chitin deacetylase (PgdA/CDA1 family)